MSNMSYCRFENTANDMRDCVDALDENGWDLKEMINEASSEHEARGIKRFVKLCKEVSESFEDEELAEL